jgi:hypothetical protein
VAILPDIHVPDHDVRALDVVEQVLATQHLDAMVQVGDVVDHESISRFAQGQPKALCDVSLDEEWAGAKAVLRRLVKAARVKNKQCSWYQEEGNHETRLKKFEGLHPQLRGLFDLPERLGINDDPIHARWVKSDSEGEVLRFVWDRSGKVVPRICKAGEPVHFPEPGLSVVHGWAHSLTAAKATADMSPWPGPIVAGHSHRISSQTSKRWGIGTQPSAHIIGTLSKLDLAYTMGRATGWEQSFALVHLAVGAPMVYRVDVVRIFDGQAVGPDGRLYTSRVKG